MYCTMLIFLRFKFQSKYLRTVKHILGWSVRRMTSTGLIHITPPYLRQRFIDILNMRKSKPEKSPYLTGVYLHDATDGEETIDT